MNLDKLHFCSIICLLVIFNFWIWEPNKLSIFLTFASLLTIEPIVPVLLYDQSAYESAPAGKFFMLRYTLKESFSWKWVSRLLQCKIKLVKIIMNNPYFNAIHVKYGNALTVHKAQGGQWSDVYIDGSFIPEKMKETSYLRWLYTAVTRSKEQLYLVNFPAVFFDKPLKNW